MEVRVRLESVSPVSWGGYDRDSDPLVVRVPSIRGTMRRWYRWFLASTQGCPEGGPDPSTIRSSEEAIFGTVHGKEARRSRIRLYFDSLEDRNVMTLRGRDPFLWPLRRRSRTFHMAEFDLIIEGRDCESLLEGVKAFVLNLTLGGFGYRSARGYGSFRISDFEATPPTGRSRSKDHPLDCGDKVEEVGRLLSKAKEVTTAPNQAVWMDSIEELLRIIEVKTCKEDRFWSIQNLSNAYLVTLRGVGGWRETLRDLEMRLKMVERSLRSPGRNRPDYRVLLGSPVLDPFRRRPYIWKVRRPSPLILGLSGVGFTFVRGVLMPSRDYPSGGRPMENVMAHIGNRIEEGFRKVREELDRAGFEVKRFKGVS